MLCKCRMHGRRICAFCIANTVGFPLEHLLWEKAPLFRSITAVFGL